MKRFYTQRTFLCTMDEFEETHNKCDVTGSICGSSIGLGKHRSRTKCYEDKKNSRMGLKPVERTAYEKCILQYGKDNEIRGIKMSAFFWPIELNEKFFYLPLSEGFDRRYGATPDGLIETDGLVEVKCPWSKNVYDEVLAGSMPIDHFCQVQMELACTMRDYGIYTVWTPTKTAIVKVNYSQEAWDDIYTRIMLFSTYLNDKDFDSNSLKFKKGEKTALEETFKTYMKKSIEYTYFITLPNNKPWYI